MSKMMGAILPGNSTVELKEFDIPKPGHGQCWCRPRLRQSAEAISDAFTVSIRKGAEGYIPGTIAYYEPCGVIIEEGEGLKRFKKGDRVIVYHISGCGVCNDCRRGYYISCTSEHRQFTDGRETAAWLLTYWQRRRT